MSEIKAQHTPGPWVVYLDTKVTTAPKHHGMHGSLHEVIADCSRNSQWTGKRDEIAEANARLIAAAPELLAALQAMLTQHEWRVGAVGVTNEEVTVAQLARAALARVPREVVKTAASQSASCTIIRAGIRTPATPTK